MAVQVCITRGPVDLCIFCVHGCTDMRNQGGLWTCAFPVLRYHLANPTNEDLQRAIRPKVTVK